MLMWFPVGLLLALAELSSIDDDMRTAQALYATTSVVLAISAWLCATLPRSLQDRLAGTFVVPR